MSQKVTHADRQKFTIAQYMLYMFVGFIIWLAGVIIVRAVGSTVFSEGNALLIVFFILSIPVGFINTMVTRPIFRLPMRDMMIPILVMVFTTLTLDGLAVGFTDIYGIDSDLVRYAAGWLLWSFGMQIIASMWMIHRASGD